jgi:Xaa-Pro aminopeptidase
LRCSIPYNPVFFAYAVVTSADVTLYIDDSKLTPETKSHLGDSVAVKPYNAIFQDLETLSKSTSVNADSGKNSSEAKFLIPTKASWALSKSLGGEEKVEEARSPVGDAKAVKNEVEMQGMRSCHVRDGAALIEYFAWLEEQLVEKKAALDEVEAADKLEEFRR